MEKASRNTSYCKCKALYYCTHCISVWFVLPLFWFVLPLFFAMFCFAILLKMAKQSTNTDEIHILSILHQILSENILPLYFGFSILNRIISELHCSDQIDFPALVFVTLHTCWYMSIFSVIVQFIEFLVINFDLQ